MKCLSIRQPYAEVILRGLKDVENRTWSTSYRGPLLIHVGRQRMDAGPVTSRALREHRIDPKSLPLGGIVGIVDLVDVVEGSRSKWATPGCFHWVVANPRRVPFTPMPGKLNLFEVPWPTGGDSPAPRDDDEDDDDEVRKVTTKSIYKGQMSKEEALEKLKGLAARMHIKASDIKVRRLADSPAGMKLSFQYQGATVERACDSQPTIEANLACLTLWLGDLVINVERGIETFVEAFYNEGGRQLTAGPTPITPKPYKGNKSIDDSLQTIDRSLNRLRMTREHTKMKWDPAAGSAVIRIRLPSGRVVEKASTMQDDARCNVAALALWLQVRAKNYERGIEVDMDRLFAANLLPPARV